MTVTTTASSPAARPTVAPPVGTEGTVPEASGEDLVEADLLVEDVSIDGMCGVY
jgi:mycofactocin precursor